ncbi:MULTISPECIES: response regulator [Sandaracinus]|uniref:response regulator n=1 Tax=Sandaracinus TaxID=1055688 RepID=UPI0019D487D5|nr:MULTISPECIES: response regulator [Sandaracinus]
MKHDRLSRAAQLEAYERAQGLDSEDSPDDYEDDLFRRAADGAAEEVVFADAVQSAYDRYFRAVPRRPDDQEAAQGVVLYVEDDTDVRDVMASMLEREHYVVRTAGDGREALEMLRGGLQPDVILLDLMMPVMDGWEFRAAQLRDPKLAAIPTVLVSAVRPLAGPARSLGAAGYLEKPFRRDDLLRAVGSLATREPHAIG